ncbi:MAG TPA: response regulator [Bradyrhizobium sp.]|nr:response regulator [Bradyrhizobium sp.]
MPNDVLIAIVDDGEPLREAMQSLLKALGFAVETFASAEEFLKFDRLRKVACLIADVQMPGMSGPELHRQLVASGNPIPTILMTAYPDDRVRTRALQDGVACYLIKPVKEDHLLACIRSSLGPSAATGQVP